MITKRILLVEDDKAIARLILDNLRFEGFSVEWCESGRNAVAVATRFAPALVLLDLMLPDGPDGLELCRTLTQAAERTPVIIITARGEKEDRVRGLTLGADDYVVKPFALDELLARIHAVLRRTKPRMERLTLGLPSSISPSYARSKTTARSRSPTGSSKLSDTWPTVRVASCRATSCCGSCGATRMCR